MAGNRKSNSGGNSGNRNGAKKKGNKRGGGGGEGPPTAVRSRTVALGPTIARGSNQNATFSNSEFITDVFTGASGSSQIIGININPANTEFTPWLSRISYGYELYRFRRISVTYNPTCSTSTAGVVVMACDYDSTDNSPTTKQQLSGYAGAVRTNAWAKGTLNIQPMDGWYYTGLTAVTSGPPGTDPKFYDMGKFYYGLFNGTPSQQTWGELTVSYTVEFAKPEFTILPGLSERLYVDGSDVNLMGGTSKTINGNPILDVSSPAQYKLRFSANYGGEYFLTLVGTYTPNTTSVTSPINPMIQTDQASGGTTVSSTLAWGEQMVTGYVVGATTYFFLGVAVALKYGTVIDGVLAGNVSAFKLLNMRVSTYRRSLA